MNNISREEAVLDQVAAIFGRIIKRSCALDADIIAEGVPSLEVARFVGEVSKRFDLRPAEVVSLFFDARTLSAFAEGLSKKLTALASNLDGDHRSKYGSHNQEFPLTAFQFPVWLSDSMSQESDRWTIHSGLTFVGGASKESLQEAVKQVQVQHPALRTELLIVDGLPWQRVRPISAEDLAAPKGSTSSRPELASWTLSNTASGDIRLDLRVHHLIVDGWSHQLIVQCLLDVYSHLAANQPDTRREDLNYYTMMAERASGIVPEEKVLGFIARHVRGRDPSWTALPRMGAASPLGYHAAKFPELELDASVVAAVKTRSRELGASVPAVVCACYLEVIARLTSRQEATVGCVLSGRRHALEHATCGMFVNVLPITAAVRERTSWPSLIKNVQASIGDALELQLVPYSKIMERAGISVDPQAPAFMQFGFNYLSLPSIVIPDDLNVEIETLSSGRANHEIGLRVEESTTGMRLSVDVAPGAYGSIDVGYILHEIGRNIRHVVDRADDLGSDLGRTDVLLSKRTVDGCVDAVTPVIQSKSRLVKMFAASSARAPNNTALTYSGRAWTYRELFAEVETAACFLAAEGVQDGTVALVVGTKHPSFVVSLLAVRRLGAIPVLADPATGIHRLKSLVEASQPDVIVNAMISDSEVLRALSQCRILMLDIIKRRAVTNADDVRTPRRMRQLSFDYVIGTSGTTGTPLAVAGLEAPIINFLQRFKEEINFSQSDTVALLSGTGHDPLWREIFLPIWTGATVAIPRAEQRLGADLVTWLGDAGVTVAHMSPSLLRTLPYGSGADCSNHTIRVLTVGGEIFSWRDAERAADLFVNARMFNAYGTSETPQIASLYAVDLRQRVGRSVPIGRGFAGFRAVVVDDDGHPLGTEEVGEIIIVSNHLARGYWSGHRQVLEDLPLRHVSGVGQGYRTGDLGRVLPDGSIEVLGRKYGHVLVNGHRVDPSEVKNAILSVPDVLDAELRWRTANVPGEARPDFALVHVEKDCSEDLEQRVRLALPAFCANIAMQFVSSPELTANNKVSLGLPDDQDDAPPAVVQSGTLATVLRVWQRLLTEDIGDSDVLDGPSVNFFSAGGDSVAATRMTHTLSQELQVKIPLRYIFDFPQAADFAAQVDELLKTGATR